MKVLGPFWIPLVVIVWSFTISKLPSGWIEFTGTLLMMFFMLFAIRQRLIFRGRLLLEIQKPRVNWLTALLCIPLLLSVVLSTDGPLHEIIILITLLMNLWIPATAFTDKGIVVKNELTAWREIDSYSFYPNDEIGFKLSNPRWYEKSYFRLKIRPTTSVRVEQVRETLSMYLSHIEAGETESNLRQV